MVVERRGAEVGGRRRLSPGQAQFAEHVARATRGEPTTLDPYGAENRAEFFAVATEAFFEKPAVLRRDHPHLYALLVDFFKLDPAEMADLVKGTRAVHAALARSDRTAQ